MPHRSFNDLHAFVAVAMAGSFTRAAAQLGMSQSALSQTVRKLEEGLGVRLLSRSTRSLATTEAGQRLLDSIAPQFSEIETALDTLGDLRDRPAGTVRISAGEHVAVSVLQPALAPLLAEYTDVHVELSVDYGMIDIVAERFDAGVRLGEQVAKDMVAVRISPDMRMAVVASPAYLAAKPAPVTPQDLITHRCINARLPTLNEIFAWEFEKDGRELRVRVEGPLTVNSLALRRNAALDNQGLAYLPEPFVRADIEAGALISVLEDWCPTFPGYHLYYPSRRQNSAAFSLVIQTLRYRI